MGVRAEYDFWLADGSPDFGFIEGGVRDITDKAAPIRLQRGNSHFGAEHIILRHKRWVNGLGCNVPELVWKKCRSSGSIYCTEEPSKCTVWMPIAPDAVLVIRYMHSDSFWTVITMYPREGTLDGECVGRYVDTLPTVGSNPAFTITGTKEPAAPLIIHKKRRQIVKPPEAD